MAEAMGQIELHFLLKGGEPGRTEVLRPAIDNNLLGVLSSSEKLHQSQELMLHAFVFAALLRIQVPDLHNTVDSDCGHMVVLAPLCNLGIFKKSRHFFHLPPRGFICNIADKNRRCSVKAKKNEKNIFL